MPTAMQLATSAAVPERWRVACHPQPRLPVPGAGAGRAGGPGSPDTGHVCRHGCLREPVLDQPAATDDRGSERAQESVHKC